MREILHREGHVGLGQELRILVAVRVEGADVIVSLPEEKKTQNVTVQPTADGRATRPEF